MSRRNSPRVEITRSEDGEYMLKGANLQDIGGPVLALVIFAVVVMGGAARRFHKRLD